jgi:demethylmenaquinone methyltransferase/2-methoxy-6-polyprenyl-1,4-benzoquinol methylase
MREMFGAVAPWYDIMNTLMSLGLDRGWRRRVVSLSCLSADGLLLDVGAGTGRITIEAARAFPEAGIVAVDITPEMMAIGMQASPSNVTWVRADALHLPFGSGTFDAVTSGFLMRNVPDVPLAFSEQLRVLKPGGRAVCLDAGPESSSILEPMARFHLDHVIPRLGALVTGHAHAYRYLPESMRAFMDAQTIASVMRAAGFVGVGFERRMLGTISIVHGRRAPA